MNTISYICEHLKKETVNFTGNDLKNVVRRIGVGALDDAKGQDQAMYNLSGRRLTDLDLEEMR